MLLSVLNLAAFATQTAQLETPLTAISEQVGVAVQQTWKA